MAPLSRRIVFDTADVLIEGDTIREVRTQIDPEGHTVVDATGLYVLPGGIDAHTHLDMPFGGTVSADDFLTGTRAAAIGGTTTIVDFAMQAKGTRMREALDIWRAKADGKACIDYGLHMIVTDLGSDNGKQGLHDMDDMVREGVASFKLFMAYPNVLMVDDGTIFKAMQQTAKNGALVCMHAENGSAIDVIVQQALAEGKTAPLYHALTRPTKAEAEAVHRSIALAEMAGVPVYIVHLSSEDALNQVREARDRGACLRSPRPARSIWCSRSKTRCRARAWKRRSMSSLRRCGRRRTSRSSGMGWRTDHLQVVSTDHCPFCFADQKPLGKDDFTQDSEWRAGRGEPHAVAVSLRRECGKDYAGAVRGDYVAPRRRASSACIRRRGRSLRARTRILCSWDPKAEHLISAATHNMRCDYSMFEGWKVKGNARQVFSRGELVVDDGSYIAATGRGQYLRREASGGAWQ